MELTRAAPPCRDLQDYLLFHRRAYAKGTAYFLVYSWLLYGCGGSFWMAYWRGGGIVPGAGEYKRGDEEARVQNEGIRGDVGRFVLGGGDETVVPDQEVDEEEVDEAREEQGLLDPVTLPSGSRETWDKLDTRDPTRHAMLQVKSDGSARFCRKVRRSSSQALRPAYAHPPFLSVQHPKT